MPQLKTKIRYHQDIKVEKYMAYLDHPIVPKLVKVPDGTEVSMARKRLIF